MRARSGVVPLGHLARGEVEPAERAELVVGQRRDRTRDAGRLPGVVGGVRRGDLDPGQGKSLGVDQLEAPRVDGEGGDARGDVQRDQSSGALEAGQAECAVPQQLEVVELSGTRAVLGQWLGRWLGAIQRVGHTAHGAARAAG